MGSLARLLICLACAPALACEYPDEGNLPVRRAVAKVKYLPETEAWAQAVHRRGGTVHYLVRLDEPRIENGKCFWPVEVRAGETLWRRFYVTPDGKEQK